MPNDENITSRGEIPAKLIPFNLDFSLSNNWHPEDFKKYLALDGAPEKQFLFINRLWKYKNYIYKDYRQNSNKSKTLINKLRTRNNHVIKENTELKNLLSKEKTLLADKRLAYTETHITINQVKVSLIMGDNIKINNIKCSAKIPDVKEY